MKIRLPHLMPTRHLHLPVERKWHLWLPSVQSLITENGATLHWRELVTADIKLPLIVSLFWGPVDQGELSPGCSIRSALI